jgi:hypothetical protein
MKNRFVRWFEDIRPKDVPKIGGNSWRRDMGSALVSTPPARPDSGRPQCPSEIEPATSSTLSRVNRRRAGPRAGRPGSDCPGPCRGCRSVARCERHSGGYRTRQRARRPQNRSRPRARSAPATACGRASFSAFAGTSRWVTPWTTADQDPVAEPVADDVRTELVGGGLQRRDVVNGEEGIVGLAKADLRPL